MTNFKFDEKFIQEALNKYFAPSSIKYNIDNLYVFDWESDKLLETRSGYIYEFEIKISKADFINDFKNKKDKHAILEGEEKYGYKFIPKYYEILNETKNELSIQNFIKINENNPYYLISEHKKPNFFYYATPTNLITPDDVPEYAGLIYVDENKNLTIAKLAPTLHKTKYNDAELNLSSKFYWNMLKFKNKYYSALNESNLWKQKFVSEVDSKNHEYGYLEMENMINHYQKDIVKLNEQLNNSNNKIHKNLYHQNRMIALLIREIQKYNPKFDAIDFELQHFGSIE